MTKLIGNALIFLMCALIQFNTQTINQNSIIIMLIALIISMMRFVTNEKRINRLLPCLYLVICLILPELTSYIPVMLWYFNGISDYVITALVFFNIIKLLYLDELTLLSLMLIISAFTIFINYLITTNSVLANNLRTLRDTSKEHELLIEEKNRELIKSQDAEIYTATLKERNRIAREIHDNVGHMLTRSILQIGAIKTINKDESLTEHLNNLHDTLSTAMTNIRESVHDLHDESIDLKNAISDIINPIKEPSIIFDYDMSKNVPRNVKYCFISVIKETINNTIKHSNADKINIILREHPGFYQLLVEDNGKNININYQSGIGLNNIEDRVRSLNGNIKIISDDGFKIMISIVKERLN
ncbi:MAG: sensor histidine kinase [Lachnospiraceae bacterium]|nr:sensor histidine kinase [Lachnospiraceae bacterium]